MATDEFCDLGKLLPGVIAQLRIHMSNIQAVSALLVPDDQRELNPGLDRRAAVLDKGCYEIRRLLDQVSLLYALEDGYSLKIRDIDLKETVCDMCEKVSSMVEDMGLQLKCSCQMETCICAADQEAVEIILGNLLSNALKFTRKGTIMVELRRASGKILLSVEDTGVGIEDMTQVFESYRNRDLPMNGIGVGLTLSQKLAQEMDGVLLAKTRANGGSQFTLSIPDRVLGETLADLPVGSYGSGHNINLLRLADALPSVCFELRRQ